MITHRHLPPRICMLLEPKEQFTFLEHYTLDHPPLPDIRALKPSY